MTKVRKPGGFFEENAVKPQSGCRAFYGYTVYIIHMCIYIYTYKIEYIYMESSNSVLHFTCKNVGSRIQCSDKKRTSVINSDTKTCGRLFHHDCRSLPLKALGRT